MPQSTVKITRQFTNLQLRKLRSSAELEELSVSPLPYQRKMTQSKKSSQTSKSDIFGHDQILKDSDFEVVPIEKLAEKIEGLSKFAQSQDSDPISACLLTMGKRLIDGMPVIEKLEDKNVIMVLGPTGSGKSTVANAFIKGSDFLKQD